MFKIKLNNKTTACYQCPLTKVTMNKPCGVGACHANLRGTHPTNCLYQIYGNKFEFDKFDLIYCMNLSDKTFKEKLNNGKQSIFEIAVILNILTRLRDNDHAMHCPNCGALRTTKGNCLNVVECNNRAKLANKVLTLSCLSYPEFKASKNDVFLMLNNKDKLTEYIENNNWNKEWGAMLGFPMWLQEKANLVRSCV